MPSHPRITIITVAHDSAGPIAAMLASVPAGLQVVAVDNASRDVDILTRVVNAHDGASIVTPGRNLGFGAACNLGAAPATTEFLLFLNPDTTLDPGALDALLEAADAHPDASAFNPLLIDDDGTLRYKRRSPLVPRAQWMPRGMGTKPFTVCILVGAAFFVRRAMFERVGGFDPSIFLYYEDDDLSVRLAKSCGPLMIVPGATVRHSRGASSGHEVAMSAFKSWHFGFARVYATRKHQRPFARTKALFIAVRKLLNPVILGSAGERVGRWAHLRGTVAAVLGKTVAAEGPK